VNKTKTVQSGSDTFEFEVDSENTAIVQRHFTKHTKRDIEIHSMPVSERPFWLFVVVKTIRFYQKHISERLGNRCVFDPSCSRYSEMAFRKYGFIKGIGLTVSRLKRCKPHNGGVDELI